MKCFNRLKNALKRDIIYHKIFSIRSLKKTGANAPFFILIYPFYSFSNECERTLVSESGAERNGIIIKYFFLKKCLIDKKANIFEIATKLVKIVKN